MCSAPEGKKDTAGQNKEGTAVRHSYNSINQQFDNMQYIYLVQ